MDPENGTLKDGFLHKPRVFRVSGTVGYFFRDPEKGCAPSWDLFLPLPTSSGSVAVEDDPLIAPCQCKGSIECPPDSATPSSSSVVRDRIGFFRRRP